MGHKNCRRVRKIEVPTDSVPEFELGDTVANIQWRRKKGGQDKGRKRHRNRGRGRIEETHL